MPLAVGCFKGASSLIACLLSLSFFIGGVYHLRLFPTRENPARSSVHSYMIENRWSTLGDSEVGPMKLVLIILVGLPIFSGFSINLLGVSGGD